jgi:hypothetical protein
MPLHQAIINPPKRICQVAAGSNDLLTGDVHLQNSGHTSMCVLSAALCKNVVQLTTHAVAGEEPLVLLKACIDKGQKLSITPMLRNVHKKSVLAAAEFVKLHDVYTKPGLCRRVRFSVSSWVCQDQVCDHVASQSGLLRSPCRLSWLRFRSSLASQSDMLRS